MLTLPKRTTAPTTPGTDKITLYANSNERLAYVDDTGTVRELPYSFETSTFVPAVQGTGSNPTVTYTAQVGRYTQIGNVVFYHLDIIVATISGGSGNLRITLPKTALNSTATYVSGMMYTGGVDLPGTPVSVFLQIIGGQAYGEPYIVQDNAGVSAVLVSGVAATDVISASGWYFVA